MANVRNVIPSLNRTNGPHTRHLLRGTPTLAEAADALDCSLLKISRIERGHIGDSKFLTKYHTGSSSKHPLKSPLDNYRSITLSA